MQRDNQGQLSPQTTSDDLLSKATALAAEVSQKTKPEEIRVATGAVRRTMRGLQSPVLPSHDLNPKSKKPAGLHRTRGNGEIPCSGIKRYKRHQPSCEFKMSSEPIDELQILDLGLERETTAAARKIRPVRSCWTDPDQHLVRPQPPPSSISEFLSSAARSVVVMGRARGTPQVRPVTSRPNSFGRFEPKPPAKSTKASSTNVKRRRLKKALPASLKPHQEELSRGNSNRHLGHTVCTQRPLLERRAQMNCCATAERLCAPVPPAQRGYFGDV